MITANRSKQLDDAKHNITVAQKRQKEQYDRKHSRPQNFEIGTKVLKRDFLRRKRKGGAMDHKCLGPYEVVKNLSKGSFTLQNMESGQIIQRIHGAHLKLYFTPTSPHSPSCISSIDK